MLEIQENNKLMCLKNIFYIENECEYHSANKAKYRKIDIEDTYHVENECRYDFTNRKPIGSRTVSMLHKEPNTEEIKNTLVSTRTNLQINTTETQKYFASIGAVAAGIDIAGSVVGAVAVSETYSESFSLDKFDHVLQKDTPITDMVFFSAHNAGALYGRGTLPFIANQTMSVKEILDRTPVRAFDFDVYHHNGELIISHSDVLDPIVKDSDITKFKDVLTDIDNWQKKNPLEVILVNIEIQSKDIWKKIIKAMSSVFGKNYATGLEKIYFAKGRTLPTIRELAEDGIKIVIPSSFYKSGGNATLKFIDPGLFDLKKELLSLLLKKENVHAHKLEDSVFQKFLDKVDTSDVSKDLGMPNSWEDRTVIQYLYKLHKDAAGKLNVEDVDRIIASKKGHVISLDHLTPNDPRFFKPEDREALNLNSDMEVFGYSVHGVNAYRILHGIEFLAIAGNITLSTIISCLHGVTNEMQIRKQSMVISKELSKVAIGSILKTRFKNNKECSTVNSEVLTAPITVEELKEAYRNDQIFKIVKATSLPGASATTTISSSIVSLGLMFPPLMITLCTTATALGITGITATLISTALNVYRLGKSIDEAFELPHVKAEIEKRVTLMNQIINDKIEDAQLADPTNVKPILDKIVQDNDTTTKLVGASIITTSTSLISRITGFAKYKIPIVGSISAGVCATSSIFLTSILATMNFKERRKKLENISTTVISQVMPDLAKKSKLKLAVFGKTAIESFIEKDHKNLLELLHLPEKTSFKDTFSELMLSENSTILDKYIEDFSFQKWEKDLIKIAKDKYPTKCFNEITQDKQLLDNVFKKYMQNQIGKFASRNTWVTGLLGLVSIVSVGYFSGMLCLPFIGAFFPVAGLPVGGSITALVATKESKLFVTKFNNIVNSDPYDLSREDLRHRKEFDSLLLRWEKLFYKSNNDTMDTI